MLRRMPRQSALLLLLGCLASTPAIGQDQHQKYHLEERRGAAGDVCVFEKMFSMQVTIRAKLAETDAVLPATESSNRHRERYRETVLSAGKDGPTHIRRTYAVAREQDTPPGGEPRLTVYARQGKTIAIRTANGKTTVTCDKGKLPPGEAKQLTGEFTGGSDLPFYPRTDVGPGDEWTLDLTKTPSGFQGMDQGAIRARFVEVTQFKGHPCAHLAVTMEGSGVQNGTSVTMQMSGDAYHALDLDAVISAKLSGPMTVGGTVTQMGTTIVLEGSGTAEFAWTQDFLKIAGKPAAPAAAVTQPVAQ